MGHDLALEDEHQQDDPVIEEETLESAESTKSLVVKVNKVWMVYPQQPTKEEVIYMSNIDRMVQYPVELFFIYPPNPCKSSEGIFDVLREAMAKLLVPYHFMAGRFKFNKKDGGRLDIACNREGATFIAASTESTVHDLGDIFNNLNPALRQVLPAPLPDVEDIDGPLLMIQVTRFKCGGFAVGSRMSHSMLDGIAVVQFYRDFCSLARNNTVFHNPESNLRSLLKARNPPMVVFDHPEMCLPPSDPAAPPNQHGLDRSRTLTGVQAELVTKLFPFSPTMIEQLKKVAMDDGTVAKCTTFEVVVANFWLARTKTINFKPGEHSKILFSVNFRDRIKPSIPESFVGNAILSPCASVLADELCKKSLSYCVTKVQEAMARVDNEYVRSAIDWLELHPTGLPAMGNNAVLLSTWWRFPFYEMDYGWGKPTFAGPPVPSGEGFALLVSNGTNDGGLNLMFCLPSRFLLAFHNHLYELINNLL